VTVSTELAVEAPTTFANIPMAQVTESPAHINMLVYGAPGVGKTHLAATADDVPEMRPVLYLNIEGGDMTLRHVAPRIRKIPATGSISWGQFEQVYETLRRQTSSGGPQGNEFVPRTIIIDTGTELQKMNMAQIMANLLLSEPDKEWDEDVPDIRRWGKNTEQMRRWIRRYRDLPLNVIMTCHEMTERDNMTGKVTYKPQLSGKLSNEVAGFFDVVTYLYVKNETVDNTAVTTRKLLTGALDGYIAKDRSGNMPQVIENPTMKEIFSLITAA
jgi:hypothetical protein